VKDWIVNGFKNHVSKLWDLGNVKILDFQEPGKINWWIRFTFLEDMHTLCITGDLGYLVAVGHGNMTYARFPEIIQNKDSFRKRVQCHDMPFWEYDEDLAKKDLEEHYKDEIEERIQDLARLAGDTKDPENERKIFWEAVFGDFDTDMGIGLAGSKVLTPIISEFPGVREYIGRKETDWIDIYFYAFEEAVKRLPEQRDNITKFESKINELADLLPDYGERQDEYNPVMDDLMVKYKSVAYLAERLALYSKTR
jgi:hypothetical protein